MVVSAHYKSLLLLLLPGTPRRGGGGGGKRLGRARGDVYSGGSRICNKKGGGRKHPCASHTGGVQRPALGPLPGAQGAEPPEAPWAPGSSRVFSK